MLIFCVPTLAQQQSIISPPPTQFELARHTFFDFGPPSDFYEIFVVRPLTDGTSIERITVTPPGDVCMQPAKVEIASGTTRESVEGLLGGTNPCLIPETELRRERKRCKKCLVFSGANVAMQIQCGRETRVIRSDILDKDMFDPAPDTPKRTSWTMSLLAKLDAATGPGVMNRPMFFIPSAKPSSPASPDSDAVHELSLGTYDALFQGAPDKPSDLYHASRESMPAPTVELMDSEPLRPEVFVRPTYPPIARAAHIEGTVTFTVDIGLDGTPTDFAVVDGHPMLRAAVQKAVAEWKFSNENLKQTIQASIKFNLNCPSTKP
jgi:TonB family protein